MKNKKNQPLPLSFSFSKACTAKVLKNNDEKAFFFSLNKDRIFFSFCVGVGRVAAAKEEEKKRLRRSSFSFCCFVICVASFLRLSLFLLLSLSLCPPVKNVCFCRCCCCWFLEETSKKKKKRSGGDRQSFKKKKRKKKKKNL